MRVWVFWEELGRKNSGFLASRPSLKEVQCPKSHFRIWDLGHSYLDNISSNNAGGDLSLRKAPSEGSSDVNEARYSCSGKRLGGRMAMVRENSFSREGVREPSGNFLWFRKLTASSSNRNPERKRWGN